MIFRTLCTIVFDIENFGLKKNKIKYFTQKLLKSGFEKVNYIKVLKEDSLSELDTTPSKCRIFISITIDGVRLIDNLAIKNRLVKENNVIKIA